MQNTRETYNVHTIQYSTYTHWLQWKLIPPIACIVMSNWVTSERVVFNALHTAGLKLACNTTSE